MSFSELPDGDDPRLQAALARLPVPPTPDLLNRVRSRLRWRRRVRLGLAAAAVLLLAVWQLPWNTSPPRTPSLAGEDSRPANRLLWEPPVERLDVIDRERDALLAALEELGKE